MIRSLSNYYFFAFLFLFTHQQWIQLKSCLLKPPPHIYQNFCRFNSTLEGNLLLNQGLNIRIEIFIGRNALPNSLVYSNETLSQLNFSFGLFIQTSDFYIIRIQNIDAAPSCLTYSLSIKTNGDSTDASLYTGTFFNLIKNDFVICLNDAKDIKNKKIRGYRIKGQPAEYESVSVTYLQQPQIISPLRENEINYVKQKYDLAHLVFLISVKNNQQAPFLLLIQGLDEQNKIIDEPWLIVGSVLSCALICLIVFIALRYWKQRKQRGPEPSDQQVQDPQRSQVDNNLENQINFSQEKQEKSSVVCGVCLGQIPDLHLECGHQFHEGCIIIQPMMKGVQACPTCKKAINNKSDLNQTLQKFDV